MSCALSRNRASAQAPPLLHPLHLGGAACVDAAAVPFRGAALQPVAEEVRPHGGADGQFVDVVAHHRIPHHASHTRTGRRVLLPADYVAEQVELG